MSIWTDFIHYLNRKTLSVMIGMYCNAHHSSRPKEEKGLCAECSSVYQYALGRLDRCPFGAGKPNCPKCPLQCYSREKQDAMKVIMRYSGPRMGMKHPLLSLYHLLNNYRKIPDSYTHSK